VKILNVSFGLVLVAALAACDGYAPVVNGSNSGNSSSGGVVNPPVDPGPTPTPGPNPPPPPPPPTQSDLYAAIQGNWISPCQPSADFPEIPEALRYLVLSVRRSVAISNANQIGGRMEFFSNNNCTGLIAHADTVSNIVAWVHPNSNEFWYLNMTFVSGTLRITNTLAQIAASGVSLFGYNTWIDGQARDILGRNPVSGLPPLFNPGQTTYSLMQVLPNIIRFGAHNATYPGTSPETRPIGVWPLDWTRI